jgi:hypothetical protein
MTRIPCVAVALLVCAQSTSASEATFEGVDPLAWVMEPHARTSYSAAMSVEALPGDAVYRFVCREDDSKSRDWAPEPAYEATGLTPESSYTFVAEARVDGHAARDPSSTFTVTTRVADSFDDIAAGGAELIPIMVHGDKDNRINIVVVNRWRKGEQDPYNRPEMRSQFVQDVRDVIEPAFDPDGPEAVAPFANQREFYNVYALWWPGIPPWDPEARDRGERAAHWETYNEMRARLFLPWSQEGRGWVTHMAMVNSRGGGGGAGLRLEERVGDAMIEGNEIDAFYHEFAHTALRLGDKYIGWGMWGRADESSNTTLVFQRDKVKWRKWIDPDTPVPTPYRRAHIGDVGLFEGGTHRAAHIFRATPVCTMGVNQFSAGLCILCVQEAAQRPYEYVDALEHATPARAELALEQPGVARFAVSRVRATPDTQRVVWTVNGKPVAEGVDEIEVEMGAVGRYEVVCALEDRSPHIREDPPFAMYPRAEKRWSVTNPHATGAAAALQVSLASTDLSVLGVDDGAILATATGGVPPYSYLWSDGSSEPTARGLGEGDHSLLVVDAEFRAVTMDAALARANTLTVTPRSERTDGAWNVTLDIVGVSAADVTCEWSTGAQGLSLHGVADGSYGYTVTHASGVTVAGDVQLVPASRKLTAAYDITPATGSNDGQIRVSIDGGRAPYTVRWGDGVDEGVTTRRFLPPGEYAAIVRDANSAEIVKTVTVESAEPFELARPVFERGADGSLRIVEDTEQHEYHWYSADNPTYILPPPRGVYEGTFTTADGRVVEADGAVIPNTNGKWANAANAPGDDNAEHNRTHNDDGSWVRLDAFVHGREALPMTVKLQCDDDGTPGRAIDVTGETSRSETTAEITGAGTWRGTASNGRLLVEGTGVDGGSFDLLYTARHENPSDPLHIGPEFLPPALGGYYVAARRLSDGAMSRNRVGLHVQPYADASASTPTPVAPDAVTGARLLLWLDAADMDGDGVQDAPQWPRGSLLGWQGDPGAMTATSFVIYESNALNGKPVADWQYIWLQSLAEPVEGYRTVMMVYRDHDLSKPGSGPWQGVDAYLWDLSGEGDSVDVAPQFRDGRAWLNGRRVDPYATPAPADYCVATFELAASGTRPISRTHTEWEGAVAEFIAFDGVLSDSDRTGVEEHLRRKWLDAGASHGDTEHRP